jgi:DNA-binding NarL/FixJ family response regulator
MAVLPRTVLDALLTSGRQLGHEIRAGLTDEDVELWAAVARDCDPAEMTAHFGVSERTIKRMTAALLRKLEVTSRVQAAALAGRCGLLEGPDDLRSSSIDTEA